MTYVCENHRHHWTKGVRNLRIVSIFLHCVGHQHHDFTHITVIRLYKNVGDIHKQYHIQYLYQCYWFNVMENYLNRWLRNKLKITKNREIELWRINARKQSARFETRSFVDKLVFSPFSTCQTLNVVCLFTQKMI